MVIARLLDCMCLALRASGLWHRYATLQNLIPSFPCIAPPHPPPWHNPRKGRDQILLFGNTGRDVDADDGRRQYFISFDWNADRRVEGRIKCMQNGAVTDTWSDTISFFLSIFFSSSCFNLDLFMQMGTWLWPAEWKHVAWRLFVWSTQPIFGIEVCKNASLASWKIVQISSDSPSDRRLHRIWHIPLFW